MGLGFPDNLLAEERSALAYFKNSGGHELIRDCQLGILESTNDIAETARKHCRNLSSALAKARVFSGTVFRGMWAADCYPEKVALLRSVLEVEGIYRLPAHGSASLNEAEARAFAVQEGNTGREVSLAIVIRVLALTARDISAIPHLAGDEREIMLLKDTRYDVSAPKAVRCSTTNAECWTMMWTEVA